MEDVRIRYAKDARPGLPAMMCGVEKCAAKVCFSGMWKGCASKG